jgi:hypothetical protein
MQDDHDHSHVTHSAKCDEKGCKYIAETHAHDGDTAAEALSHDLAHHNKSVHNKDTNPNKIKDAVKAKMQAPTS